jgi:hypothetical protein
MTRDPLLDPSWPRYIWRRFRSIKPVYWFRSIFIDKYHIVDARAPDYGWGWIDRDHLMFNACFNILTRFVEEEKPDLGKLTVEDYKDPDRDWMEHEREAVQIQVDRQREIATLYDWWKIYRWEEHKACERLLEGVDCSWDACFGPEDENGNCEFKSKKDPKFDVWSKERDRLEKKDEEMFERLMKVRQNLWS